MPTVDPDAPVRHLRELAGLSQAEVARRIGDHQPNIARDEVRPGIRLDRLARIAEACGFRLEIQAVKKNRKKAT